MTSSDWVPFGLDDDAAEEHRVLVDGVPDWLKPSLLKWLQNYFSAGSDWVDSNRLQNATRATRLKFRADMGSGITQGSTFRSDAGQLSDLQLLQLTDWALSRLQRGLEVAQLSDLLRESSSKWTVGERGAHRGLVARVAEGVQDAAEALIAQGGTAGRLLADAWQKVHRLAPDDSGAYADAVRAVEVASFDALGIDNSKGNARLGQVIVMIRKNETWRPPFEREHPHHPVNQTLVGMLRTLWVGHRDRHGKADYTNVTHEEAESAVTLAVTLVGWFTSGAVQQRPQPEQFDG